VSNGLKEAITVRLGVSAPKAQSVTIGNSTREVTVPPGHEKTLKIQVQSAGAGSTTLSLWLETPVAVAGTKAGTALSTAPASSTCSAMACVTVQATHFGTVAIIIIVLALLLFVLSAATRAIRRGSGPGEASAPGTGPTDGGAPGTGHTETGQAATAPAVG
ncbi:MAG TPA: hypothetical protein VGS19_17360, partial [Streptosporangiaceae bacterium]|nr:hypothetical protein [Streptosporangiaceae bacterium]